MMGHCQRDPGSVIAFLAVAAIGAGMRPAFAQTAAPLRGEAFIAGRYVTDPAREPKNTHAYLTLQGPAAVQMYRNMKAKEQQDLCVGDGRKLKRAGQLSCSLTSNGQDATCDFSINLLKGILAGGRPC
jgi:hypothetical protein